MKKIIRLTEGDLHNIIKNTVNEVITKIPGYTDAGKMDYSLDDYRNLKKDKFKRGYYVCVDTDYNDGGRVKCYIGNERDAKWASMSSEGYTKGPYMTRKEAQIEMNKILGQYR